MAPHLLPDRIDPTQRRREDQRVWLRVVTSDRDLPAELPLPEGTHTLNAWPQLAPLLGGSSSALEVHVHRGRVTAPAPAGVHRSLPQRKTPTEFGPADWLRLGDTVLAFEWRRPGPAPLEELMASGGAQADLAADFAGLSAQAAELRQGVQLCREPRGHVLITGESGTGKNLLARLIGAAGGARAAVLSVAACAEEERERRLEEVVQEARESREPCWVVVRGGELLPARLQARLADLVGVCDVHLAGQPRLLVSARTEPAAPSLMSRLDWRFHLPPLRERRADILPILRLLAAAQGLELHLPPHRAAHICCADWADNAHDLRRLLQRAGAPGGLDGWLHEVPRSAGRHSDTATRRRTPRPSREKFQELLGRHQGNISRAADELQVRPNQIYRWCKHFGLNPTPFRPRPRPKLVR